MENINVYAIKSSLHDEEFIASEREKLFKNLKELTGFNYEVTSLDKLYDSKLALILVESGGSENEFLKVFDKLKAPFIFLTFGHNNSLAASIEILTFLKRNKIEGEILHGDIEYIASRINTLIKEKK